MKIKLVTVGKLKEKYLVDGIKEYVKRLNAYCKVEMIEVSDEPIPDKASEHTEDIIKDKEHIHLPMSNRFYGHRSFLFLFPTCQRQR